MRHCFLHPYCHRVKASSHAAKTVGNKAGVTFAQICYYSLSSLRIIQPGALQVFITDTDSILKVSKMCYVRIRKRKWSVRVSLAAASRTLKVSARLNCWGPSHLHSSSSYQTKLTFRSCLTQHRQYRAPFRLFAQTPPESTEDDMVVCKFYQQGNCRFGGMLNTQETRNKQLTRCRKLQK